MYERAKQYRSLLIFFSVFTLLYMTVSLLSIYFLPFILSLLIAVVMRPMYHFLKRRFRFQPAFTATVITLLVFLLILSAGVFVLYLIIREFVRFIGEYSGLIREYLESRRIFEDLYNLAFSGDTLKYMSDILLNIAKAVPILISFCVITFALTVYFLNNLDVVRSRLVESVPSSWRLKTAETIDTAYGFVRRFIRSYLILYLITFVEATFIFYLTGVGYPLYLGFITAFADVLPILGPGTVYVPIALRFILHENYIDGITLLVFFVITVIIRQIVEPRIVSDTVKISSIIVLSAIYFSIVSMSIGLFFYILLLVLSYKILTASKVL